jgi:uncharacterized protein (DUF2062 family)
MTFIIPIFWCGFIDGSLFMLLVITFWAWRINKRTEQKEKAARELEL